MPQSIPSPSAVSVTPAVSTRPGEAVRALFTEHGVRDVECIFPDISGYPRGKLMPAESFLAGGELRICQATACRAVAIHDRLELDGSLCQFAPRSTLKNVLVQYTALGLRPVVAPEIEFYLTAPNADPAQPLQAPRSTRSTCCTAMRSPWPTRPFCSSTPRVKLH